MISVDIGKRGGKRGTKTVQKSNHKSFVPANWVFMSALLIFQYLSALKERIADEAHAQTSQNNNYFHTETPGVKF